MRVIASQSLNHRRFEGAVDGPATISMILSEPEPGHGPLLHVHPYDETWIVERGELCFSVGEETASARTGDIVVAPPDVPHGFVNCGSERARVICIHANPTVITGYL